MTTSRLEIRIDPEIKQQAEKAFNLLGLKSLTEYVVRLMKEDSAQVIAQYESMTVENDTFDRFMDACEEVKAPNQALQDALACTRKEVFLPMKTVAKLF